MRDTRCPFGGAGVSSSAMYEGPAAAAETDRLFTHFSGRPTADYKRVTQNRSKVVTAVGHKGIRALVRTGKRVDLGDQFSANSHLALTKGQFVLISTAQGFNASHS